MRDTLDMAREAGIDWHKHWNDDESNRLEHFATLVRADEREEFQRWFVGVITQHEQLILAEREACAKVADLVVREIDDTNGTATYIATAIRNRGNT